MKTLEASLPFLLHNIFKKREGLMVKYPHYVPSSEIFQLKNFPLNLL